MTPSRRAKLARMPGPKKGSRPVGTPEPAVRIVSSRLVPQANKLPGIRQLVASVADGITDRSRLLEALGLDSRHYGYYRAAALILGLLEAPARNKLRLTQAAMDLLTTPLGSPGERTVFRSAIVGATSLRPFGEYFAGGDDLAIEVLADRLVHLADLSPSTARRRAHTLQQWRRYLDEGAEDPAAAILAEIPQVSLAIEAQVARHNALVKQQVRKFLAQAAPEQLEQLLGKLLKAMGYADVAVTPRSGDDGVDVTAKFRDEWAQVGRIEVQCKRNARPVGRRVIDEFAGALRRRGADKGIFVALGGYTAKGREAAEAHGPSMRLVDGAELVGLLVQHGCGLRSGDYGELLVEL